MSDVVRVEQRLQDMPQFFIFPADDAMAGLSPVLIGLVSRNLIAGIAVGLIFYFVWKRVKGERGVPGLLALLYWILPRETKLFRSLPDSAVTSWRA